MLSLQVEELTTGLGPGDEMVARDYMDLGNSTAPLDERVATLQGFSSTDLIDLGTIASVLGFNPSVDSLEAVIQPKGYRSASGIKAVPPAVANRLVDHFDGLQNLMAANIEDLMAVDGIGERCARTVREGLSRIAETSLLDRFM